MVDAMVRAARNATDPAAHAASHLARNVQSLRQARRMTQQALAKAADVPRSTVANMESGGGNPSLAVLLKVATALGAPIDELLSPPHAKVRKWPGKDLAARTRGRGVTLRALVPEPVPAEILELMEFAPGATMAGQPHLPGTREFFSLLEGQMTIFVAGTAHALAAGDVLGFPGNVPHSYRNNDAERPARGVSVVVLASAGV
jgi:transcriptional regulator with XRE-family HTH domain